MDISVHNSGIKDGLKRLTIQIGRASCRERVSKIDDKSLLAHPGFCLCPVK